MVYRVLALDPGGTTGWASYTATRMITPEGAVEYYDEKWSQGQIGPMEHHAELWSLLELQQTQEFTVVCESFEFRNMDRRDRNNISLISREYIGVTKLFHQQRMEVLRQALVLQTAGLAKSFFPDSGPQANKKLRETGLWHPNNRHAMDATRHLLWYLINRQDRNDLVRRWWKPGRRE